jgi:hypothetical protein
MIFHRPRISSAAHADTIPMHSNTAIAIAEILEDLIHELLAARFHWSLPLQDRLRKHNSVKSCCKA